MPLILVTGLPSSGKSKTAAEIGQFLEGRLKEESNQAKVTIVSDTDILDWDGRNDIYMSIAKEKDLRGWLKAEALRYVNLNHVVILDASAYIKGFRYEIFCLVKEAKTQYCIVEKLIDVDTCWNWNRQRMISNDEKDSNEQSPHYSKETFDALVMRYEKCDENNRWDSPIFRIHDIHDQLNMEELYEIVTKDKPLAPNKCISLSANTTTIFKPSK